MNSYDYYQLSIILKTFVYFIFLWWICLFDEYEVQKNSIYFKCDFFCIVVSVFAVTFDQFNASLLNKH